MKPASELEARIAVAGLDAELIQEWGLSPEEADAIVVALRRFLLGDVNGARQELQSHFDEGMVERVLDTFRVSAEAA